MPEEKVIEEPWQEEVQAETITHVNGNYINLFLHENKKEPSKTCLGVGQWVRLTKSDTSAEPNEIKGEGTYGPWTMYQCFVKVDTKDASFVTFDEAEANAFSAVCGVGEEFLVSKEEYSFKNKKGQKQLKERLVFQTVPEKQ